MPIPVPVGDDGFCHPCNEGQIIALVKWCHDHSCQLRVRGSGHSFPQRAIYTDRPPGRSSTEINVMLDRYRGVRFLPNGVVEVEAGCHFSIDPHDPTRQSTLHNGLLYQLQENKLSLSDLGGISHQTVGGFLSTGSSGGSTQFSLDDDIVKIRFIDGTGTVHDVSRDDSQKDLFEAIGVSMGLLGIISKVTFCCKSTFNIRGYETTTTIDNCEIDLFGDGQPERSGQPERPSLANFLRKAHYTRIMWWPQPGVERVVVWNARRETPPDPPSAFQPQPYREMGPHPDDSEMLAGLLLSIIGNLDDLASLPQRIEPIFEELDASVFDKLKQKGFHSEVDKAISDIVSGLVEAGVDGTLELPGIDLVARLIKKNLGTVVPMVLNDFNPLDPAKNPPGPQKFWDYWWRGLPMDDAINDALMPVWFTEIWIRIGRAKELMCVLRDYFRAEGLEATGTFAFEIYAAKKSPFWMSPSFGEEDMVRFDVFWFGYNSRSPDADFFYRFWNLLKPFDYRLHWGKFLPRDPPPKKEWARYLAKNSPKWDLFLEKRRKHDPKNVFLTRYWREHLGLENEQPEHETPAPLPAHDPFATHRWRAAQRAVTMLSWVALVGAIYGTVAAHLPAILGHHWSACQIPQTQSPLECVLAFHILEGPFIAYLVFLFWAGLWRLRPQPARYAVHASFGLALLGVFFLFQIIQILDIMRRSGPRWEIYALYSFAAFMGLGTFLGLWTRGKLALFLEHVRPRRRHLPWGW